MTRIFLQCALSVSTGTGDSRMTRSATLPSMHLLQTTAPVGWNNDQVGLERSNRRHYFTDDFAGADHELVVELCLQMRLSVLLQADSSTRFPAMIGTDSQT